MLQLPDSGNAQVRPVHPARPGVLSVWVASPGQPRPCLLADLIARIAERHHLRAGVSGPIPAGWDALNVYPAEVAAGPPEPLDIAVAAAGEAAGSPAHLVVPGASGPVDLAGAEPLALRLALLRHPYRQELTLTPDEVKAAGEDLTGWRALVSHWAQSPSKPLCAQYVGDFLDALDNGLDTPAALATLAALAADALIPNGSKFESFAYADRILGLDLAREVGR